MKRFVCQLAASLLRAGHTRSEALRRAWATAKLRQQMLTTATPFSYVKDDGTIRRAVGCYAAAPTVSSRAITNPYSLAIRYFDQDVPGWRSFRADRLVF
nr:hypothetical protein A6C57_00995 [Fibrella sp. ES10-3-2-2]